MLDSNTNLKAAIADWLNRSDLTTQIVDFIRLAEARIARELKTNELHTTTTLTIDAASEALPTDFAGLVYIKLQGNYKSLDYMAPDQLFSTYAAGQSGRPIAFTIQGNSIYFAPSPDVTYTADYTYIAVPDIATDSTNRLLVVHPDLYLFGALAEAYQFLGENEAYALAESRYQRALMAANESDQYKGSLQMFVEAP